MSRFQYIWQTFAETFSESTRRRHFSTLQILLVMCLNLALAPAVLAATGAQISRSQAYSIAALGLLTFGLGAYLVFVIFQPEKF
ncbi:MAG TPA: K(+)-transporting ATPase subunit F [Oscillatoriaceae cyanobacterium M33_DOE_052]|uniref:K(+)-transporting ATPase subunit F n=1 Tax=Planktothricoides sp. SpSt-374 TaxID=2282167 RepID=A0A7C3VER5_9CYAN|nr:K(+)-transporting ATPase subunit F [Oscillatoriaceae cyanobacterium M33_DOE_052]